MDDHAHACGAAGTDLLLCPECGRPSRCERRTGCASCWCAKYPRVVPMPADQNAPCLCEECLRRRIAALTGGPAPS